MSQAMGRKRRSTWLPPQPDASAELAVPEPAPEAREARRLEQDRDAAVRCSALLGP
jgi:hypothetical protein